MKYRIINFAAPKSATMTEPEIKNRLLEFARRLKEERTRNFLGLPDLNSITKKDLEKSLDDLG